MLDANRLKDFFSLSPLKTAGLGLLVLAACLPAAAQTDDLGSSEGPKVLYTEARRASVGESLQVMGTVVAPRSTWIGAEVAGAVAALEVRTGDKVRQGQVVARLRTRPLELRLEAARGLLVEAEARHHGAELRLERLRTLQGSEVVSSQTVDDALYELQSQQGQVQRLKAEVEAFADDLDRAVLRAPFAGVITAERTQVGQWIDVGAAVVELVALDGLEARLDIPEHRWQELEPGAEVLITSDALPGRSVRGTLRAVVPQASERARTFPAFVALPRGGPLAAGVLVRAELSFSPSSDALLVPGDAVVTRGGQSQVFVLGSDSVVRSVSVRVDGSAGTWRKIYAPSIRSGDFVVTHGNETLQNGDSVSAEAKDYPAP